MPGTGLAGRQALARAGLDREDLPRGGVVVGAAGSGKTTVLRAIAEHIDDPTITLSGVGGCAALVFGPLVADGDLSPGRLRWSLATAVSRRPGEAMMVDDADRLDDEAAALVHSLVVHEAAPILLSCTVDPLRPDPAQIPEAIRALWKDGHLPRFDLRPIDTGELTDYLQGELGAPPTGRDVQRLTRWCGGDLAALTALIDSSIRARDWRTVQGVAVLAGRPTLPLQIREQVAAIVAALPTEVREVLDLLAAAVPILDERTDGWLPLAPLSRLYDFSVLVEAERCGVIESEPASAAAARVRLSAPLLGEVITAQLPGLRRLQLIGRLRDAVVAESPRPLGDETTTLRGLLDLSVPPAAGRTCTLDAGRSALRLGDPAAVSVLAGGDCANDPEGAALAAWAKLHLGDVDGFEQLVAAWSGDRSPLWRGLGDFTAQARQWQVGGPQAFLRYWDGEPGGLIGAVRRSLATDRRSGAWFGLLAAGTAFLAGRFTATNTILEATRPAARDDGLLVFYLLLVELHLDLMVDGGERACERTERARDGIQWRSDELHAAADFACALAHLAVGSFGEAITELRSCIPFLAAVPWRQVATHLLGRALAMASGTGSAGSHAWDGEDTALPLTVAAAGLDRAWAGAGDDAADAIDTLLATAAALLGPAPVLALEQLETALRFLPPGDGARVRTAVDALARAAGTAEHTERVGLIADYGAAVNAGDGAALAAVAARYQRLGLLPVAADAYAQAAAAHRRTEDERAAAINAIGARDLVAQMGGLHSPAQRRVVVPELTRREQDVVASVALGLSNREIADRLHLSVRTVEGHLLRAGMKTGLRCREDLARYWRERAS